MAKVLIMPKVGNTVESVIIGEVKIKIGDKVKIGDILFDYETDKASTEYKSEIEGEVLALFIKDGDEVTVLDNIMIIGKKGEDIEQLISKKDTQQSLKEEKQEKNIKKTEFVNDDKNFKNGQQLKLQKLFASPRAKRVSKEIGVELKEVEHVTGANNRIIEKDILNKYYQKNNFTKSSDSILNKEFEKVMFSSTRKRVANGVYGSLQNTAQLTLQINIDATDILEFRKLIKENYKKLEIENSSINDIFIYALSRILTNYPKINSTVGEDFYTAYNVAHISFAVDTEEGLLVPVIKNASNKSLGEISRDAKTLIEKARNGKIKVADLTGGTFTITNLGLSGVSFFTPILNYPQSTILGVGSPIKKIKLVDNKIVEYDEITLSLTMDHRTYDGADGARFLKELKLLLENLKTVL